MSSPSMHTDCQLLDALEKRQSPNDPQSLAARLTQLCQEQALMATPEDIVQAAAEVAEQQQMGLTATAPFTGWKRPSAQDWTAIQADLAWVERLWSRTFRNMKWGVLVVGLGVAGRLIAMHVLFHESITRSGHLFTEIMVGALLTGMMTGAGGLIQALAQGSLSNLREVWRLRRWARQLNLALDTPKYALAVASANPEALARWRQSPTARRHLKAILAQSVPLLALDAKQLDDLVEWESYEQANAVRQQQWQQGLREVAMDA